MQGHREVARIGGRPLLSGWLTVPEGGGGGLRGPQKVFVPKIDLQVRAPLINFTVFLRENCVMWVGVWVGAWVSQNLERAILTAPPPAWTWSVHLDAPGQRHGQQPISGTADPRSSQTGHVIQGLR